MKAQQEPLSNMTDDELVDHMHKHVENMREEYPDQYHEILSDGMIYHIADMAQRLRSRPQNLPCPDWQCIEHSDGPEWCCNRKPTPETEQAYRNGYDDGYALAMKEAGDIAQRDREEVLDKLIEHFEKVISDGQGYTYNHSITNEWMYRGVVVNYLESLRSTKGGEREC